MRGMTKLTPLQELERELSIEKAKWRREGKGIHWDNIKTLREQIKKLKDERRD